MNHAQLGLCREQGGASLTLKVGPAALVVSAESTFSFSVEFGQDNSWGGSSTTSVTIEDSVEVPVPSGHRKKITMEAALELKDVPYVSFVKRNYANGTSRVVKDIGTYKGAKVGTSHIIFHKAVPIG